MSRHLGDQLSAYVDRRLPGSALLAWDRHVLVCTQCRYAVDQERGLLASLRSAPEPCVSESLQALLMGMGGPQRMPGSLRQLLRPGRCRRAHHRSRPRPTSFAGCACPPFHQPALPDTDRPVAQPSLPAWRLGPRLPPLGRSALLPWRPAEVPSDPRTGACGRAQRSGRGILGHVVLPGEPGGPDHRPIHRKHHVNHHVDHNAEHGDTRPMSEHPDRPAVDPGAGEPPAPWASSGSPVGAPDTQGEPTQVLDSVPTAPLSQSFPPPPSGGVFGPPYAAPPPPDLGPDYPPVGPGPTAERSTGHAPGGFPAPGFPAPGYPAPGHPPAGTSPAMAYPSLGASQTPARRSRLGAGALALAAVVGLVAGLLGGAVGSALVNRGVAVTQGQSPLPAPLPGATTRPEGSIAKIAATALPSVVTVTIVTADATGNGSGFVIDRAGHILTNNHVVSGATGAGEITVEFVDGTSLPARIVGRDSSYDLAVLAVDRTELTPFSGAAQRMSLSATA